MNAERRAEAREWLRRAKQAPPYSEVACWLFLREWAFLGGKP